MAQDVEKMKKMVQGGTDPAAGDKAKEIFSDLFGGQWWKILWSGKGVQGDPSLIIPILEVFNYIVMIAVAILLLYIVGHAFVGSAHEGTPLGSRMHSIWVPIRAVLSMSLLAPIPWAKSLSVIQGIVLAFVGFSIQLGNMVATTGLNYISENHGQIVSSTPKDLTTTGSKIAEVGLHNYLIQYHQRYFQDYELNAGYKVKMKVPGSGGPGSERDYSNTGFGSVLKHKDDGVNRPTKFIYKFKAPKPLDPATMGSVTVSCKDPSSRLCKIRKDSVASLLAKMELVASQRIRILDGKKDVDMPDKEAIVEDISEYGSGMMSAIHQMIESQNSALEQEIETFTQRVEEQGFVMLGSYFWTLTRFNMAILDQVQSKVSVEDYNKKLLDKQIAPKFNQIKTNIKSIDGYFAEAKYSSDNIAQMGSGDIEDKMNEDNAGNMVFNALSEWFTGWTDLFVSSISSHDPIAGLSAWGHRLMNGLYALLATLTGLHAVPYVGKAVLPYILFIVPPLFLLGFTLAYYLPAVPFIMWISGIFGWIMMVIEALIAAPIWAAMHANPDGEGIAGDAGSHGYTLFVQVLMRPVLMVIGFFFALLMIHIVSYFGEMFTIFFEGLSANETFAGPITMIAGWFLGGIIMVILVHKAFSMIYALPEGLMKWMGAKGSHVSKGGEQQDVGESKQTFVGGFATHTSQAAGGRGGGSTQNAQTSPEPQYPDPNDDNSSGGGREMSEDAKNTGEDHSPGEIGPSEDQP